MRISDWSSDVCSSDLYRIDVQPFYGSLRFYAAERRWVYLQQLDLDAAQRRELIAYLEWNARPENAEYRYDYFIANCATRVRDALDRASGGAIERASKGVEIGTASCRERVC